MKEDDEIRAAAERTSVIMELLKPILAGEGHAVQGAVLAECLAAWLAGHPDWLREEILAGHLAFVRARVPRIERSMFDGKGHPQNTGTGGLSS